QAVVVEAGSPDFYKSEYFTLGAAALASSSKRFGLNRFVVDTTLQSFALEGFFSKSAWAKAASIGA
ncbi:MAG: hypothetical protein MJ157_06810, partial [Clostridia bacterium]|nr:hypothetical protein [Clostridia bacterium]